jgi:hypothetical protein
VDPSLRPINTVEDASDHSGASARVAGLALKAPAEAAGAADRDERIGDMARELLETIQAREQRLRESLQATEQAFLESLQATEHELAQELADSAARLEAAAKDAAQRLETKAAITAREIEVMAKEIAELFKRTSGGGGSGTNGGAAAGGSGDVVPPEQAGGADASTAAVAAAENGSSELDSVARSAKHLRDLLASRAKDVARDVADSLPSIPQPPWMQGSVSVPEPGRIRVPSDKEGIPRLEPPAAEASSVAAAAAAPAGTDAAASVAPGEAGSAAARKPWRMRAGPEPSSAYEGAEPVPLSDEPVVEIIPTRVLRTGAVVPSFIEAPLYAKPPDHDFLTPEEARMEEVIRLRLYAEISDRVQAALEDLEWKVRERRKSQGIFDERPMK